jgi:carbohydrate kinase (thermoresistant glucokinase family)
MPVPERVPDFSWAQNMGYAQSKSVAEHICAKAASQGITTRVLRIGQIVGDTEHGVWNPQEAVPMIMQTAVTIGALPRLQETPSWLPVDVVADVVIDISLSSAGSIFTNVTNPQLFNWNDDLLPALRKYGLAFDEVEPREWIKRLRASNPDPVANPPIKLVDFFASKYDRDSFGPSKTFSTEVARSFSPALAKVPSLVEEHVAKFVGYLSGKAWTSSSSPTEAEKMVIVMMGPFGTGKSTVGSGIAQALDIPFIEGDTLYSRQDIATIRSGMTLADEDSLSWIDRINRRTTDTLTDLGYNSSIVSCSALRETYRNQIRRHMVTHQVKVIFVDLQVERDILARRSKDRQDSLTGASLVDSQLDLYEEPSSREFDVVPVDAERTEQAVLDQVRWIIEEAAEWF